MTFLFARAPSIRIAPTSTTRSISHSVSLSKALPFYLNNLRSTEQNDGKVLRMLMFGKPGAGKGTLSARLVKKYDILSLSTGDLLRQHIAERTEVGRQAEEIVAQGNLLPDDVMLKVVASKLESLNNKHWILDGFPRTLGQGKLLDAHLQIQNAPLSLVINLDVADNVILNRISDRWVHLPSGRVYNMSYNRPKVDGFDDETGEPLTRRPDDNPEIFSRRLKQFYDSTSPLLAYYASPITKSARLVTLQGETSDEIWPQLDAIVRRSFPGIRERASSIAQRRYSLSDPFAMEQEKRAIKRAAAGDGP
jgi:adenylate kinase